MWNLPVNVSKTYTFKKEGSLLRFTCCSVVSKKSHLSITITQHFSLHLEVYRRCKVSCTNLVACSGDGLQYTGTGTVLRNCGEGVMKEDWWSHLHHLILTETPELLPSPNVDYIALVEYVLCLVALRCGC